MSKIKEIFIGIGAIVIFLLFLGFGVKSSVGIPDHAILYINSNTKTYYSPPCLSDNEQKSLIKIRSKDLSFPEYSPDKKCVNEEGFVSEGRSLTGRLFEQLGIIGSLPSRWNSDGSWKW